ncbi:hypothetical protein BHE74_00011430 [Ensete ventricosum]|nr:hypothetical protein BHE74_00011430 [Ensete ventricosum]
MQIDVCVVLNFTGISFQQKILKLTIRTRLQEKPEKKNKKEKSWDLPAHDLMVWILRRRTRTLMRCVMSPANLKMFISGDRLAGSEPNVLRSTGSTRRSALRSLAAAPLSSLLIS